MEKQILENVEILDAGSEGKAIARVNDRVVFVPFVVPGDVADILITRRRSKYLEGKAVRIRKFSDKRQEAFCQHFGTCGGCRWQNIRYVDQLYYKQKQVADNIQRIGKIDDAKILPILPSEDVIYYRNKLEFTFSNRRWMTGDRKQTPEPEDYNALGFHLPGMFDRVLDINKCWLQADPSNAIRLFLKNYAQQHHLSFYDVKTWNGILRNLIIRNTTRGDVMVVMIFRENDHAMIHGMLDALMAEFPQISSLYFIINNKKNDSITDLVPQLYSGTPYITEVLGSIHPERTIEFRIGPLSFYQTNPKQAQKLYRTAGEFCSFAGTETVYDLYTGIGSIASFIAPAVGKVIGIESVSAAVEDATENARRNGIENVRFYAGEAEKLITPSFFEINGNPEIIITDPPRSGMHENVVKAILNSGAGKVVYVSCNPATQARDIGIMKDLYNLEKCQPVDMFPHTQHVENVALLVRKDYKARGSSGISCMTASGSTL
jgi:23S rRNA (uracil1939-C5)-methyltransferase